MRSLHENCSDPFMRPREGTTLINMNCSRGHLGFTCRERKNDRGFGGVCCRKADEQLLAREKYRKKNTQAGVTWMFKACSRCKIWLTPNTRVGSPLVVSPIDTCSLPTRSSLVHCCSNSINLSVCSRQESIQMRFRVDRSRSIPGTSAEVKSFLR